MNLEPQIVTETKPRKSEYPWRHVWVFNKYSDGTLYNPWDEYPELLNLSVHRDFYRRAEELSHKFHSLGPYPDKSLALPIVEELLSFCEVEYEKKSPLKKWEFAAIQMPDDIGGITKEEEARIITSFAKGKVLETMCGFNSYFQKSEKIQEVVVLDFCKEMLMRYEFPERTRILFDLERVVQGERLDFFDDGRFDTIGSWGTNYLSNELPVFKEFARILNAGGKLIVLENTNEGYRSLVKRYFKPSHTAEVMKKAGLVPVVHALTELNNGNEYSKFFLVEGIKE